MTPDRQSADPSPARAAAAETVICPGCRAEMPREMRFCRMCGFRLGEGLAEYVETVRFDGLTPPLAQGAAPLAPSAAGRGLFNASSAAAATTTFGHKPRRRRRRWLVWPLAGLVAVGALTAGGVIISEITESGGGTRVSAPAAPRSFFGGGDFAEVDGVGLLVESVLPGGPAEQAGLQDGDIIKSFDGSAVEDEDDLRRVLRATPAGKSVPVEFVRDGLPMHTMLTTIPADAYNPQAFMPPGGSGYWGVSGLRRVPVEGTNFHGVRLGGVLANRPADIAGLKEDDIVIEFDGRPVRTADGLSGYIDRAAPGTQVRVTVIRDGQRLDIPVKMGRDD